MWNCAENQIELVLIRHGKTEGNLRKAYIGSTDEPLCEEGISFLLEKQKTGYYPSGDLLFSSPLQRCIESAGLLYPFMEPRIIDELRETDFGEFEGKTYQELSNHPAYQAFIDSNGESAFPGGESKMEATERSLRGMQKVLKEAFEGNAKRVIAMVHGGTIMATISSMFGGSFYDYQIKNAEGYSCLVEQRKEGYVIVDCRPL